MRPAAIALNYSVKDIRNDVRQIIYEKSQLNRLVWGSLTLAPITLSLYVASFPDAEEGEEKERLVHTICACA